MIINQKSPARPHFILDERGSENTKPRRDTHPGLGDGLRGVSGSGCPSHVEREASQAVPTLQQKRLQRPISVEGCALLR
jgi:hypothetical protein